MSHQRRGDICWFGMEATGAVPAGEFGSAVDGQELTLEARLGSPHSCRSLRCKLLKFTGKSSLQPVERTGHADKDESGGEFFQLECGQHPYNDR
jgi:hypothetical protein